MFTFGTPSTLMHISFSMTLFRRKERSALSLRSRKPIFLCEVNIIIHNEFTCHAHFASGNVFKTSTWIHMAIWKFNSKFFARYLDGDRHYVLPTNVIPLSHSSPYSALLRGTLTYTQYMCGVRFQEM